MARVDRKLLAHIREALAARAVAEKGPAMQAYMKSQLPFLGVSAPERKQACKEVLRDIKEVDRPQWRATARALWDHATHREMRYAAIALTGHRPYLRGDDVESLPLYDHFIVDGAWWDYVDEVAIHRVGPLVKNDPETMKPRMRKWSVDADRWRRRTAIIGQIAHKGDADLDLLYACIEPSIEAKDFFLRKGIGWALRQVAWYHPDEIVRYVTRNAHRLSGLSKREALKNVLKSGAIDAIP